MRIMVCDLKVEGGRDVHDRERAAGVTGSRGAECDQIVATHQVRRFDQFLVRVVTDGSSCHRIGQGHNALLRNVYLSNNSGRMFLMPCTGAVSITFSQALSLCARRPSQFLRAESPAAARFGSPGREFLCTRFLLL